MLETLDAAVVGRWCAGALAALRSHQHEMDSLNVYPVPDGDTGTNLVLTLTSAQQALAMDLDNSPEGEQTSHGHVLRLMARGALLGARGNSGVILSQILRGLADALATTPVVRGRALAGALRAATTAAYAAVAHPVEGTVLSVVAAAAEAAERTASDELGTVVRAAATAAADALARTPEQLPALKRAGVVDAGGRGFCLLIDALVEVVTGERRPESAPGGPEPRPPATAEPEAGPLEYAYEVQFLLDAEADAVHRMREVLDRLGDSLVVVGAEATSSGPTTWHVHVHVNDVGAAVEAGVVAGRPHQISVTRFADQIAATGGSLPCTVPPAVPGSAVAGGPARRPVPPATAEPATAEPATAEPVRGSPGDVVVAPGLTAPVGAGPDPAARAWVVVAAGSGIAALLTAEGATVVDPEPTVEAMLEAIRSSGAAQVVVLPDGPETRAVAGAAAHRARRFGIRVSIVPTRSPVQALAALAVRDPRRLFEDDVIAMAEAAGACRHGEICQAGREALTVAGRCRPGDVLALVEGEVHLIGTDLSQVCRQLLDRMLGGGGELVTLLLGTGAPEGLAQLLRAHVSAHWPFVEVQDYLGGQPDHPLLVGVE